MLQIRRINIDWMNIYQSETHGKSVPIRVVYEYNYKEYRHVQTTIF
jgi:hypothetical protein